MFIIIPSMISLYSILILPALIIFAQVYLSYTIYPDYLMIKKLREKSAIRDF